MTVRRVLLGFLLVIVGLFAYKYTRTNAEQRGYRGLAMFQLKRPFQVDAQKAINAFPKPLRPGNPNGPKASEVYQNVQVLGDLTQGQMVRLMLSIKAWVAPDVGCDYCHAAPDYASDAKYTKRVAREMLRMVRHINSDWTQHVGATGVTCYTCHRGQPVPAKEWFAAMPREQHGLMPPLRPGRPVTPSAASGTVPTNLKGDYLPTPAAASTTLPNVSLGDYLQHDKAIRIVGTEALQAGNRHSINQAKETYSLMMVMSESLGVNCTFCHNTKSFFSWDLSPPQRATAWYGIRMVRDLNNGYIQTVGGLLPANRLGPGGDNPKVYCATCHRGSNKPLGGAPMLKFSPELVRPAGGPATAQGLPASIPAG